MRSLATLAALLVAVLWGSACATSRPRGEIPAPTLQTDGAADFDPLFDDPPEGDPLLDEAFADPAERDPGERVNRGTFGFNERLRAWLLTPVARVYEFAVPETGRRAIFRFFANLEEPVIFVNDLLQLEPVDAGSSGARFVINTTVGLVGLFDLATGWGLERHETDFGQTLAVYRVESGPYVVIPVLGPSTARDLVGTVVDAMLRPDTWLLSLGPRVFIGAGSGIATYDVERERLEALRDTSVDFYAALRGAYLLDRDATVEMRIERVLGDGPSR